METSNQRRSGNVLLAMIVSIFLFTGHVHAAEPVGHWRFDEGEGSTAIDSSGNDYNGTISGATYSGVKPDLKFENLYSLEFDGVTSE